jgi:hypothetical protein
LAALLYSDIFSLDFLTPLCDADTQFKLEPHNNLDLSRYIELVQNTNDVMGSNAPDLLGNVYTPRGNIQVHSPYLEVSAFNPRSRISMSRKSDKHGDTGCSSALTTPRVRGIRRVPVQSTTVAKSKRTCVTSFSWKPWKRKTKTHNPAEKMLIPLPIPHPVHIAISIYNRDSDQPIILESDMSFDILRSIEECHGDLQAAVNVSRFRGGGADDGSGSGIGGGIFDSSMDSLGSQSSGDTRDSMEILAGGTETLPCTNREICIVETDPTNPTAINITNNSQLTVAQGNPSETTATTTLWTLSNWGANSNQNGRRRNNNLSGNGSETVRVELASPEDISLDTDSRVVFSAYGTTV